MGIKEQFFKWFKAKVKDEEINLGYVLEGEPKTEAEVEKLFKALGLASKFQLFKPLIRPKIDVKLSAEKDENIKIGKSKIGGKPDLLAENIWPKTNDNKSLSFIAQLNCEEVSLYDKESLFPKNGLISFFYCSEQQAWGFDPKDIDRFMVIYTEDLSNLKRIDFPKDLEEHSIFTPNMIKFDSSLSLPNLEYEGVDALLTDKEFDKYSEIAGGAENQILGYANCIQSAMELECQLVTNGLYCGDHSGYNDPRSKELEQGSSDWVLLFQIDSEEENVGMMWGDSGKLYFWIRKQDLKEKNFSKCWFILQCY